jgi:hypothetical protein
MLSTGQVKVGDAGPVLTVTTAAGAMVHAGLWMAGTPLPGLSAVSARADGRGAAQLQLPAVPRTLAGAGTTVDIQVVLTATLHGDSTQITLPLTVVG